MRQLLKKKGRGFPNTKNLRMLRGKGEIFIGDSMGKVISNQILSTLVESEGHMMLKMALLPCLFLYAERCLEFHVYPIEAQYQHAKLIGKR
jgi:hypothetical protein